MEVDINLIQPNSYNPKVTEQHQEEYRAIVEGIKQLGMKSPIDVREIDGPIPYEIIDGYHRWTACKELGWTKISISSWGRIDDTQARKITILKEKARVPLDLIKTSQVLNELAKTTSSLEELSKQLGYSIVDLQEDLKVANFNWGNYNTVPQSPSESPLKTLHVIMPDDQYKIVQEAIAKAKLNDAAMTDGRALELISIEFINSPEGTIGQ
jgi:ParB/RepB/Spo0J family partition protein